jgi:superfamily II DNA or RNA helicase
MRPYAFQRRAVDAAQEKMNTGRRVLVTSPPGSGKTVMLVELARRVRKAGGRTLIIAQRREILEQTFLHMGGMGVRDTWVGGIYPDPHPGEDESRPIQIASMATLLKRGVRPQADVVLLDEAHHASAEGHSRVLGDYEGALMAGLTATPVRMDGRGLGDIFDEMVVAALPSQLINVGRLAKPRPHAAREEFQPNLRGLRRAMGDYVPSSLEDRMMQHGLIGNIIDHYHDFAAGKTAIVFASGINHSRSITARFRAAGVPAEHLDGNMNRDERDAIVERLRAGRTLVVSNVSILHEGFDLPRTYAVILARPTKSLALYLQQTGRALRTYGEESPIVLDHARNFTEHGYPEADRVFRLRGTIEERGGAAPVRACPNCGAVVPLNTAECPDCGLQLVHPRGEIFEDEQRRLQEIREHEREEFKRRIDAFIEEKRGDRREWAKWGEWLLAERDKIKEVFTAESSSV